MNSGIYFTEPPNGRSTFNTTHVNNCFSVYQASEIAGPIYSFIFGRKIKENLIHCRQKIHAHDPEKRGKLSGRQDKNCNALSF